TTSFFLRPKGLTAFTTSPYLSMTNVSGMTSAAARTVRTNLLFGDLRWHRQPPNSRGRHTPGLEPANRFLKRTGSLMCSVGIEFSSQKEKKQASRRLAAWSICGSLFANSASNAYLPDLPATAY